MATTFIALLRGINVSGRNTIPMGDLRALCAEAGWTDVQTYIQSGNMIIKTTGKAAEVADKLEELIAQEFELTIPVIVRTARQWSAYLAGNPFPVESEKEGNAVVLCLSKEKPKPNAVHDLSVRATHGERIVAVDDAIWIHFAGGIANSKLAPGLFDKAVGSPVTTRNWRTVRKLHELAT